MSPPDPTGDRSLLDPTRDRPEEHLRWDLLTGQPVRVPIPNHRGERTISACGLRHQTLNEERRHKAALLKYLLLEAVRRPDPEVAARLEAELEPTRPWLGVVRQILLDPRMAPLVDAVLTRFPQLGPRFAALRWTHP